MSKISLAAPEAGRIDRRANGRMSPESVAPLLLLGLTVVMILASRLISPSLGSWSQVLMIVTLGSFLLVVSFGQGLVVLSGGMDLSVASLFMYGGVMSAGAIGAAGGNIAYMLPLILLSAAAIGALSGLGITLLRIPPFIMTMGTGIIVASLALGATGGSTLGASPKLLADIVKGSVSGIPCIVLFTLVFSALGIVIQTRTVFGRNLYALGGSPGAARVGGIPVGAATVAAYALSGLCAALGGALLTGYSDGATLRMGDPYLLPSIAAVVVGGSSILGGKGTFIGTIAGSLFLTTVDSVIAATSLGQGWRLIVSGAIITVALLCQSGSANSLILLSGKTRALFKR
ncbi:ABC transporter permease [Acerihabitans arboris]|uniref:ABC transporter permease n=1 Tax=Acerihabitans arboris TaxID=2691583 RepID=A0A845SGX2_9GAMM|nr:ABC transporter permease [Acerihabitans arboris]NDL62194.1 ABC transporter permease [Acerihabitans arboris]